MAEDGSWPSIERHGLLSTTALLDLFGVSGEVREGLEGAHRPEAVPLVHPLHGNAVVRDQKPMDDRGLRKCLQDGLSPTQWYRLLNGMVFFWVSEDRLATLLGAKAYRDTSHVVLTVDTERLLSRYADRVMLCPINSGATKPNPTPRGAATFQPISTYPLEYWERKRSRSKSVVELTVKYAVPDVRDLVVRVERVTAGLPRSLLWEP